MGKCKYCEVITSGNVCQTCRKYLKNGGEFHTPPEPGTVAVDSRGFYICHICGMAYMKLGEHVKLKHKMSINEYREKFGLMKKQQLTGKEYHKKMSEYMLDQLNSNDQYHYLHKHPELRCQGSRKNQKQSLQEIEQRRESQSQKSKIRWEKYRKGGNKNGEASN